MNWTVFAAIATAVGVPPLILGTIYAVRANIREARTADASQKKDRDTELQARFDAGFAAGVTHAEPAAALLTYQRDDARRERDNERADRIAAENRAQELQDRLRPRPGRA